MSRSGKSKIRSIKLRGERDEFFNMARKYDLIIDLYNDAVKKAAHPDEWKSFLKTACRNYKLRFDEQLLLYAQRPDATAVLPIERWNISFGRWVKRGTKGIAVFEDEGHKNQRLIHYFDISDTRAGNAARPVPIWKMKPEYETEVINMLESAFGELKDKSSFANAIISVSEKAVENNISNYLNELLPIVDNTFLEDLDESAITAVSRELVTNSVAYMAMERLGIDADMYFSNEDFQNIVNYSDEKVFNVLGVAASSIAAMCLSEIAKEVNLLNRKEQKLVYDVKTDYNINREKTERSFTNGRNNLHETGRLSNTRSEASGAGAAGGGAENVRANEKTIFEGAPQGTLLQSAHELRIDSASGGDPAARGGDGGNSRQTDGEGRGGHGGTEGERHDGVGAQNEQHSQSGEGDSQNGGYIRLEWYDRNNEDKIKPLPSMDGQLTLMMNSQAEERKPSAFTFSQEIIDEVLTRGSGVSEGKMRIYEQLEKSLSAKENADFLKKEYGWGGVYPAIVGVGIDEQHDGKGIRISRGFGDDKPHIDLSWQQVEKRIAELIRLDRYLSPKEKACYPEWLQKQEERRAEAAERRRNREILFTAPPQPETQTDEQEARYEYHLGDSVYIGASEYEILSLDESRVMLYDTQMPLFNKELTREEFDRKVRENPMNDHLKVTDIHAEEERSEDESAPFDINEYDDPDYLEQRQLAQQEAQEQLPRFDSIEFEKLIPHEMRFKEVDLVNDNEIFWVTQEPFTIEQLREFQQAVRDYDGDIKRFYVTPRDLSGYNFEEDLARKVLAVVTPDTILKDDYVRAMREEGLADYLMPENPAETPAEQVVEKIEQAASEQPGEPVQETPSEPLIPNFNNPKSKAQSFDLHPDIPMSERHTFNLKANPVETVGKKERFRRNIMAIQLLKKCQEENRFATPEEQVILSKYVGWGGIPEAFDKNNSAWGTEYLELKTVLTPEEYTAARESTLTAFYTPPEVTTAIYNALSQMDFREGNLLEPSCGVGNFIGMLPQSMENAKIYGVELDPISAGIAQQLYQKSSIAACGFEEVNVPDSFFDGVVGNVPFGDFKVLDKRYDKHNFLIHDYFFAKSLDKLRPGGMMALVTSKGTMDKTNPAVRKYIAQRAELLGAIRLPNNTFKGNAGTEVVSDILFLQKRDRLIDIEPDWVHLDTDKNGIQMNSYFVRHPEMVLGEMKMATGRFGTESTCEPYENADLERQLAEAISNIHGEISDYETDNEIETEDNSIPADPNVRNFSYTVVDDAIYFRENSKMTPVEASPTAKNRIKGMIAIRDCVRELIELQTEDYSDSDIKRAQDKLNTLYDNFTKEYGLINSRANASVFDDDSSYPLLVSLEVINENGELERKADMFSKRTIKPHIPVTEVDTASEALAVSMGEKAAVDMSYMQQLTGKTEQEIYNDLKGVIFLNPLYGDGDSTKSKYLIADEYLSGNVREKLAVAKKSAEIYPEDYTVNVEALERVQPKDLTANEISVRLGATWLPPKIVEQFIYEFLDTPRWAQWNIKLHFSAYTGEWNIEGKSYDQSNVKAYNTYGTSRINAYKIIEETLNLKDVRIFDYIEDYEGKRKAVLNKKETLIAQSKQELIKQGFQDWIWADPTRRENLTKLYNEKFNNLRPREYDGSHIIFSGMNPEIELREHQKNAVAHILYGGNTLLAHVVGAGKTYEMVAAAQESKRLGLCNKSLFVVPNHLTEQWAAEYLQLYPAANILVATKKDFETKNRKRFCGRIATGDYDAVIIGHSQFEKIPMSLERQRAILEQQLEEVTEGIADLKYNSGEKFSVKQLEKTRKSIKQKLEKLNDQSRKDDVVTFEELGVDRLFIDESHYYKNLYLYTKMRNVGGIAQTEAQKSSDLFMKCRYLDEITGGRGTVFATGTPISNSMVELYTIQRYLQYAALEKNGLQHFDAWASTFGENVAAVELTPEGTGYRSKTRFARFYNLPELMSTFKEVADIQTADMLKLPVPEAHYHNIAVKPSEFQQDMVKELGDRAEKIRAGMVDSSVDNMLKITNDGRKLALDQRLINPALPDFEGSKLNACVENVFKIWQDNTDKKLTQLIFCDLSTPKSDTEFSVYNDIRKKLVERGVPKNEIRFIHEANTEAQKQELFRKVRKGEVRVLLGSTQKMGAGTNVQDKLIALHDLDCPWRPSDLEQRSGRIIRQGNENKDVHIYRYVTEQTFDSYLYQLIEGKQKFVSQIMTSKSPVRSAEDIDETALSYAEIKMLATGNPYIKDKMDLDIQIQRLSMLKSNFLSEKYKLEDKIIKYYPQRIASLHSRIEGLKADTKTAQEHPKPTDDRFVGMEVKGVFYSEKAEAGKAIIDACKKMNSPDSVPLGSYRGFKTNLFFDTVRREYVVRLQGKTSCYVPLGNDIHGNITRIDNGVERFAEMLKDAENDLENTEKQFEVAKKDVEKPFPFEQELKEKISRVNELNVILNIDNNSIGKKDADTQAAPDIKIISLYRRDNGEEFMHYAVTNERGERRELLTNGMYAWSDNDKNAERMCSLTSVEHIDAEKMEGLLNKYQPDKSALQALEIVKGAQQSQSQIRRPQML